MRRFIFAVLITAALIGVARPAQASELTGSVWQKLMKTADRAGYQSEFTDETSLAGTIGNIINLFLGVLGTAAVILLLYAGYLWMVSGGNEDQVSKAKTIIKQVVVGLVVLSLAYAIVTFVVSLVGDATAKK